MFYVYHWDNVYDWLCVPLERVSLHKMVWTTLILKSRKVFSRNIYIYVFEIFSYYFFIRIHLQNYDPSNLFIYMLAQRFFQILKIWSVQNLTRRRAVLGFDSMWYFNYIFATSALTSYNIAWSIYLLVLIILNERNNYCLWKI